MSQETVNVEIPSFSSSCVPPRKFERNEYGLICSPSFEYIYNSKGQVDWRAMIPKQYLVPNKEKTKETDISKLSDKEILVLLFGFKELADIRGYSAIRSTVTSSSPNHVIVSCEITWLPNFETLGQAVTCSGVGDATPENTSGFGRQYLSPIAENRAFVRAVKNFLKINITAQDELNPQAPAPLEEVMETYNPKSIDASRLLSEAMTEKGVSWERLVNRLNEEGYDTTNVNSVSDLPLWKLVELRGRILKIK